MTWPSTFNDGTQGYMKDQIADEIARDDLTSQIAVCITRSIQFYQPHRFHFSEGFDGNFSTVIGQEFYTATDNPVIASLFAFDYIDITIGVAKFKVTRMQPEDIELLTQTGTQMGQPYAFSYYNFQLRFYPVPSAVYPMTVAAHKKVSPPANDNDATSFWMTDAELLIRRRSRYELALNYTKDPTELELMGAGVEEAFSELKRRTNQLTGTGRIRPTQF